MKHRKLFVSGLVIALMLILATMAGSGVSAAVGTPTFLTLTPSNTPVVLTIVPSNTPVVLTVTPQPTATQPVFANVDKADSESWGCTLWGVQARAWYFRSATTGQIWDKFPYDAAGEAFNIEMHNWDGHEPEVGSLFNVYILMTNDGKNQSAYMLFGQLEITKTHDCVFTALPQPTAIPGYTSAVPTSTS